MILPVFACPHPRRGAKHCDKRVFVMSRRLSSRSHISKTNFRTSHFFPRYGPVFSWRQCSKLLCASGFMDGVMFSHMARHLRGDYAESDPPSAAAPLSLFLLAAWQSESGCNDASRRSSSSISRSYSNAKVVDSPLFLKVSSFRAIYCRSVFRHDDLPAVAVVGHDSRRDQVALQRRARRSSTRLATCARTQLHR